MTDNAPNTTVWFHDVVILIPPNVEDTELGSAWITGECNDRNDTFTDNLLDWNIFLPDVVA